MSGELELASRLESLSIAPSEFDHRAHVIVAWHYLRELPLPEAMIRFRDGLKRFAAHIGKADRYHETVTFAFILLIHDRMHAAPSTGQDWNGFERANQDLLRGGRAVLLELYEEDTLSGALAKERFRLPDKRMAPRL